MNSMDLVIDSIYKDYNILLDDDPSNPIEIEFETLSNSRIVINKEIMEKLNNIALTTKSLDKEIGFIMYGKEYSGNQVLFNDITISDADFKSAITEFGPKITEELQRKIEENLDERTVVCYGHSHPDISEDYKKFSLSDLASLVELTEKNPDFKNKDIQLLGCLVTDNLKFIYYDPEDNSFNSIEKVEYE